jgi:hypothetical protein
MQIGGAALAPKKEKTKKKTVPLKHFAFYLELKKYFFCVWD